MPEISIIVPVYNVEKYLTKCIESIISQTFKDWELILVNDGSTDASGYICDTYVSKDFRIKVIHLKNGGVSKARNTGITIASGKYITFIDSDDWVEAEYLASMIKYADENTIVYGNVINDYSNGQLSAKVFDYTEGTSVSLTNDHNIVRYKIPENGFPIAKLFLKKIVHSQYLRFDENLSYHEDHLFVLKYLNFVDAVKLCALPYYHYEHRIGNLSLSKRKHSTIKMIDASRKLIQVLNASIKRWNIYDPDYVCRLYTYLGLNQLMIGLKNASDISEFRYVTGSIRDNFHMFRLYYKPNHKLLRIIPYLIYTHFDKLYIPILKWKEKAILTSQKG